MATKPTKHVAKETTWKPQGFVNLYLTEGQLDHAWTTFEDRAKVYASFENEMGNGYRFTFSIDAKTGAFVCTCNCKDESSPNFGWLLSSFAPTWEEALILTLYKHLVVLEAKWGDNETIARKATYG